MQQKMTVGQHVEEKVLKLRQDQQYQQACCAVYESLHGKRIEVTAPHQYFEECRKHYIDVENGRETNKQDERQENSVDSFTQL
jgi:hypothetical protein